MEITELVCVLLAVPVGRNGWVSKEVMDDLRRF